MKLLPYAKKLREATGRSVDIKVEHWAFKNGDTEIEIGLSFLPGLDGSKCSAEKFTSVEVLKARCAEIIRKYSKREAA